MVSLARWHTFVDIVGWARWADWLSSRGSIDATPDLFSEDGCYFAHTVEPRNWNLSKGRERSVVNETEDGRIDGPI